MRTKHATDYDIINNDLPPIPEAKYDRIGKTYNHTRVADPYLVSRMAHHLNLDKAGQYLDIGCGTGNYTVELSNMGFDFIGIDPSGKMLDEAKKKSSRVLWQKGFAEQTSLSESSIDAVLAGLTIHHWENMVNGFKELNKILKPNGRFVLFTSCPKQMEGYWLNHYFPKMMEISMIQMPKLSEVLSNLNLCGFELLYTETYSVHKDLKDLFLYAGKSNPSLYLNKLVQNGISSFSDLSNADEVTTGLKQLTSDIESKKIWDIIRSYENQKGDYIFIVAQKINI